MIQPYLAELVERRGYSCWLRVEAPSLWRAQAAAGAYARAHGYALARVRPATADEVAMDQMILGRSLTLSMDECPCERCEACLSGLDMQHQHRGTKNE